MRKFLSSLFCLIAFFLLVRTPVLADDGTTSATDMTYTVSTSGNTHVVSHITLTNTTDTLYVTSYTVKLGFDTISNVTATDPSGPVTPFVKSTASGQEVTVTFKTIVSGKGHSLPFTLSFDTPDVANKNGSIWEVNIPGVEKNNEFTDFTTTLSVPPSFGPPTYVKPAGGNGLTFTKEQLEKSGISLAFGKAQTYTYDLSYHLENKNVFPVRTDIALPPTTNYQTVSLNSLNPKPDNVTIDTDGNWLATYTLLPSQKITVVADGLISVFLNPKSSFLSDQDRKTYLKQQSYWQTNNGAIQALAKQLKTPEAIYDYVAGHLTYDFSRVKDDQTRLGAAYVLQNPTSAVCLEFTDLFIALSRAAGIPAREIDGFGYTQNTVSRPLSIGTDVLHAWPEYYDDAANTWVMVDPTWGNTTGGVDYFHQMDFDHVAFVIKGVSSTYPVPAGGYKFDSQPNVKDVAMSVTDEAITGLPSVTSQIDFPKTTIAGFPFGGTLSLLNTGTLLFPAQQITVRTSRIAPTEQTILLPDVPPFGKITKTIGFSKTPFLTNEADTITISLGGKSLIAHISVLPFTLTQILIGGVILAVLTTIIFIVARKARGVPVF